MSGTDKIKLKLDRTLAIVVAVIFLGGLIAGFGIWGVKKEKKADVKQLLNMVVQEVERIEGENKALKEQIKKTVTDRETADRLTIENQELREQLQKAGKYNQQLKDEVSNIRTSLVDAEKRAQRSGNLEAIKDSLQQRVLELEEENHGLRTALEKIGSLTKGQGNEQEVTEPEVMEKPAVPGE